MKSLIKKGISFIIVGVLLLILVPFLRAQIESPDDIGWPREITHEPC
jgi:competence protein ComGC